MHPKVYDFKAIEEEMKKRWLKGKTQDRARTVNKGKKKFYFSDGPPYATGNIHMGTALNKIIKDAYIRFRRMQGLDVWDQPGYDTHGTPIETKVEKQLGFESKKQIEEFGVGNFTKKCREFATKYISTMSDQFESLGCWADWKNPYLTLNNTYIEGAWNTFKIAFQRGFLIKGSYPCHVCSRCATVVAYNEIEHATLTDPAIFVKFELAKEPGTYLVIWTTTPWTIPSNTGVMVHPDYDYVFVNIHGKKYVVAKELLESLMEKWEVGAYQVEKTVKGRELEGLKYNHPLTDLVPALKKIKNGHRVVLSSRFVTLDAGTGLVHTAPGHGREDYQVGRKENLPIVSPVAIDGTFKEEAGDWLYRKYTKSADHIIIDKLNERDALLMRDNVSHEYPICWRCKTPVLQINVPQWFFKVSEIREKLIEENKKVNWIPKWAGEKFNDWLKNLDDWPISRQRYWGIPLPIWECSCGEIEVIGSLDELRERATKPFKELDLHRPAIDGVKIKCSKCGKDVSRVTDVLDVWFDSGVSTWASLGYPSKKELFKEMWPSDFQVEGPDQFRGWWNSQIITSMLTFEKAPFKNVMMHGLVLDAKGIKLSKSLGNFIDPFEITGKYGVDTFRFYLLSWTPWNDAYFHWDSIKEVSRMVNVYWNTYSFVKTYAPKAVKMPEKLNPEDLWLLSRLEGVSELGISKGKEYNLHEFVKGLYDFVLNDFSRWYIKTIRDRVSPWYKGEDKKAAQFTLRYALEKLARISSLVMPYLSDYVYTDMFGKDAKDSVHLHEWPKAEFKVDKKLEEEMKMVESLIEAMNAERQKRTLKLRWPLECVEVMTGDETMKKALKDLAGIIKSLANVKEVKLADKIKGEEFQYGKLRLGDVLKEESFLRELARKVQEARKKEKLRIDDHIEITFETDHSTVDTLKKNMEGVKASVGASSVAFVEVKKPLDTFEFDGKTVKFFFKKKV